MSYPKVSPVDERVMRRQRYAGHHTICQVLREIYEASDDDNVRLKCRTAMAMAKKMHRKLKDYREQFDARAEG